MRKSVTLYDGMGDGHHWHDLSRSSESLKQLRIFCKPECLDLWLIYLRFNYASIIAI